MKRLGAKRARPTVRVPFISKVFATMQCYWCPHKFDEFRIVCDHCHNCQYCGLVSARTDICTNCGNRLPDELKRDMVTIRAL